MQFLKAVDEKAMELFLLGGASKVSRQKKKLRCLERYPDVEVVHIDHKNPAAMADAFCDEPNIFRSINEALTKLGLGTIDWLPTEGWQGVLCDDSGADEMGKFMKETQDLHKMYLDRLKDGLDKTNDQLADIVGIMESELLPLAAALEPLKLDKFAGDSVRKAAKMVSGDLTVEEAAAIHMYTTNHIFKVLNAALRSEDRKQIASFFSYLRLLLSALQKLPVSTRKLYRGVALDLSSQYRQGSVVTWWAVSSCTPDMKVASSFSGASKRTLFVITPLTSVPIKRFSEYQSEEEYILTPGTQLKVTKATCSGGAVEIHLAELDAAKRVR